jgi:hypothetical protein
MAWHCHSCGCLLDDHETFGLEKHTGGFRIETLRLLVDLVEGQREEARKAPGLF